MATTVGEAGESALRGALMRAMVFPLAVLTFVVVAMPFAVYGYAHSPNRGLFVFVGAAALAVSLSFTRKDWVDSFEMLVESRDWARGAAGERAACADLARLPDEYLILNDVHPGFRGPSARWNWDHVVIGPKGIFVVDSKNYSARRIRGGNTDARTGRNVKQVRSYARTFKSELVRMNPALASLFIVPVLAYVNESTWVEQLRDADVRVLPKRLLRNDILTRSTSNLPAGEAIKIANLLFSMYGPHLQEVYRGDFRTWAQRVRQRPWESSAPSRESTPPAPAAWTCPKCGAPMRRCEGPYGPFYGCANYYDTGCRGKRELDGSVK